MRKKFDLLVMPFGSRFPKQAFESIDQFFFEGGNWINLGGAPLSIPVVRNKNS